jgi:hypothetical protein
MAKHWKVKALSQLSAQQNVSKVKHNFIVRTEISARQD